MPTSYPTEATEIESSDELCARIEQLGHLRDVVVQGLDLRDEATTQALLSVSAEGTYFLGCRLAPAAEQHIRETGGTLFPAFGELPFHPYRASLYTPGELMQGYEVGNRDSLTQTTDGQIYAHYEQCHQPGRPTPVMAALAYRIHDHAIDDALFDLLRPDDALPKKVVGVMGGHRMRRDGAHFEAVARIAWRLTQHGYFIATGGGPGAMEAANLGAYMHNYEEPDIEAAVAMLAERPRYEDQYYFERAYAVRERYPNGHESLAIPTWFYGHEPSNLFGRYIAKYFANSLREDGLLGIANYGVIYAPGSAGTVQEIFMDAAQNHYATFGAISPMVFFDIDYWTNEKPVYPLLEKLASGHPYHHLLSIRDEVEATVQFIVHNEPITDGASEG